MIASEMKDAAAENNYRDRVVVSFEEQSLTKEYWERVQKDMKVQTDNPVQVSKPSNLSPPEQQQLLKLVLQEGVDAWRKIAETLKLKNAKEAIFEFLRIED